MSVFLDGALAEVESRNNIVDPETSGVEIHMSSEFQADAAMEVSQPARVKRRRNGRRGAKVKRFLDSAANVLTSFARAQESLKESGSRLGGTVIDETAVTPAPYEWGSQGPRAASAPLQLGDQLGPQTVVEDDQVSKFLPVALLILGVVLLARASR